MFQSEPKPLHFLQKAANVFIVLTSLVFIALGIFLFTEVKMIYLFDIILMVLGVLSLVFVFLFHCSHSSASVLNCYLYGLSGVIMFQAFISIMTVACQNRIVEWILKNHIFVEETQKEYEENVRNKIRITAWISLAASLIQVTFSFLISMMTLLSLILNSWLTVFLGDLLVYYCVLPSKCYKKKSRAIG